MEYILEKNAVGVLTRALDSVSEQPVDIDFTLPDYCPDIEKILRCKITPKIYNRNLSGGQLQIDGTTVVNILYTDNKDNIRACEQSIPFNTSFSVKEVPDNYVIETEVKCEYLNYRPLSQRRITVHGAFSLYAKVYTKGSVELYSPNEESNLEYNTEEITLCALSSSISVPKTWPIIRVTSCASTSPSPFMSPGTADGVSTRPANSGLFSPTVKSS